MFQKINKEYVKVKGVKNMFYGNCCYNNNNNNNNCCDIRQTLEKIERLQREAVSNESQEGCCRDVLGEENICNLFNTRPITFYTAENRQLQYPVRRNDSGCQGGEKSCVFRVECVNNDSCQCRILVEGKSQCGRPSYCATDSFVTIKLSDTFVDLCIR